MLKKLPKMAIIFSVCLSLFCGNAFADVGDYTAPFPDVPADATYAEAVIVLYEMKIFNGDSDGNFNPDNTITRAETAAIICRLMGVEDEAKAMTTSTFADVPSSHWAVGYIAKAAELGVINGYGNGNFGLSDPVTYAQVVKMLVCAKGFIDEAEAVGGWPDGYIGIAEDLGLLEGVTLQQKNPAPRADVALIAYNMVNGGKTK